MNEAIARGHIEVLLAIDDAGTHSSKRVLFRSHIPSVSINFGMQSDSL